MSLYAFHLGEIMSTFLGHVKDGGEDGNVCRIRDETCEIEHGAIWRTVKGLAILKCLYG